MNRRRFFQFLGVGAAGIALDQAIPLGRVWSFPSKIQPAFAGIDLALTPDEYGVTIAWITRENLRILQANLERIMVEDRLWGEHLRLGHNKRPATYQHPFNARDEAIHAHVHRAGELARRGAGLSPPDESGLLRLG